LLIRDLAGGHSKYADLLGTLRGISPNVLSERLKLLEREGLVSSSLYSDHPPRSEYRLTDKGNAMLPVLRAFATWGEVYAPRKASPATESANSV
jgi:DNA-binding HxlR family transcriptional regulator